MRFHGRVVALLALSSLWGWSPAAAGTCPTTPEAAAAIPLGEMEVELIEVPDSSAKEVRAAARFGVDSTALIEVIRAAEHYAEFMPRVMSSTVSQEGDEWHNAQQVNFPFPISNRHYTVRLEESSVPSGDWRLSWTYVIGSGNIEDTRGSWVVVALGDESVLCYEVFSDPGGHIPGWAVNKASKSTIPKLLRSVAQRAEQLQTKAPG